MPDINLLPEEERSAESFETLRRRLLYGSIGALAVTGVLTLFVLIYYSVLDGKRNKLVDSITASGSQIESLKASEELEVVTKDKLADASKILGARLNIVDFFTKFSQLVPQNLSFSDVKLSSGKLVASGKAKSSNDMAGFVSQLVSAKGVELVSNVSVDSLSSDENGAYSFVINMQVGQGAKK